MSVLVFQYSDYKEFLNAMVEFKKDVTGYRSQMAEAAGCQRSFLSQALHSHVHLTPDHAAGLCEFWGFGEQETSYFVDLVHLARASTPSLRRLIEKRLQQVKNAQSALNDRIRRYTEIPEQYRTQFYSTWYLSALYAMAGLSLYSTAQSMAIHLSLPRDKVEEGLQKLEMMGVIRYKEGRWLKSEMHLYMKDATHRYPFLVNWRQIAGLRLQSPNPESIHITHLYVLPQAHRKKLQAQLTDFLETLWNSNTDSLDPNDEAFCLNLDLFPV